MGTAQKSGRTGWSVEEDSARGVDADLAVQVELGQGEFDRLADLLLLHVHASDIGVFPVRERTMFRVSLGSRVLDAAAQSATHTSGFSASPSIEMLESASGGRTSTSAFEWRWSATLELGFNNSRSIVLRILTT